MNIFFSIKDSSGPQNIFGLSKYRYGRISMTSRCDGSRLSEAKVLAREKEDNSDVSDTSIRKLTWAPEHKLEKSPLWSLKLTHLSQIGIYNKILFKNKNKNEKQTNKKTLKTKKSNNGPAILCFTICGHPSLHPASRRSLGQGSVPHLSIPSS